MMMMMVTTMYQVRWDTLVVQAPQESPGCHRVIDTAIMKHSDFLFGGSVVVSTN
jgi:hypothetical protein